ncbi:hypothetical protein K0B96_11065 [Horticoccus luteus]|uniref:histidine kinase n=1 Tax=Horticoccus luteus TaxID=2862869 RepID=A0A8F9XK98_9BACT|nr:ATP-binding protein [Horticoccus luteus]QYM77859.1 hypothetical protein K0B96_11065 [Horticoccus luteus]
MLITTAFCASVIVAVVGGLILWGNPNRYVNRVVFTCSLHLAAWLGCLHLATTSGENGLDWLKYACAVAAFWPLHFRVVKESIINAPAAIWRGRPWWISGWVVVSGVLAVIPFTDYFIPPHSTGDNRFYGVGYYAYILIDLALYGYLFLRSAMEMKSTTGVRKLELQVWMMGGVTMVITLFTLMGLNMVTHERIYIRMQPIMVLCFYVCTVYAITAHRVFNARQIFLVGVEKLLLVMTVAAVAYLVDKSFAMLLPESFAFLATTALSLWIAVTLNAALDRVFCFYPQANEARGAAFNVARTETKLDVLEKSFLTLLKGWGQSDHALLLSGAKGTLVGSGVELADNCPVVRAMRNLRWATPERLARARPLPDNLIVNAFLSENRLEALVIVEGPNSNILAGVGASASRRPYTYPQVTQLMELASIIESALERAHLSVKAQHAEQLATVGLLGASLAHEIRNPLVTIKTFVQLLPQHYNDPTFRDKFFRLIGNEVARIDRLTEQLLDLAAPRTYSSQAVDLHLLIRESIDLVAPKAADKQIKLVSELGAQPDRVFTDATAVKQVLLNLCFNAVQAVEAQAGPERWIQVATRNLPEGVELRISDSGPGIGVQMWPRLFQPFQSTKSTGFGLGLAICSDILAALNATIKADPPVPGRGATFRVTLPCPPSTS